MYGCIRIPPSAAINGEGSPMSFSASELFEEMRRFPDADSIIARICPEINAQNNSDFHVSTTLEELREAKFI